MFNMSNFKIMENNTVKIWLKVHVFGNLSNLQEFLFGQGVLMTGFIMLFTVLIFMLLLKMIKAKSLVAKLEDEIFWNPVFRGMIQTYFPTMCGALLFFSTF
jgi:hypothetical protein